MAENNEAPEPLVGGRASQGQQEPRDRDGQNPKPPTTTAQRTKPRRPAPRLHGEFIAIVYGLQKAHGHPDRVVEDGVGLNDGHWGHIKTPNSPSGRGGTLFILQDIADWVEREYGVRISMTGTVVDSALTTPVQTDPNHAARQIRHWRHRQFFADLGRKGGATTAARHGTALAKKRGQLGAQKRWRQNQETKQ